MSIKYIKHNPDRASWSETIRIQRAIKLANVSTMRQKHGALLYTGGRLISVGINIMRNSPKTHIPADAISTHAEVNCLGGIIRPEGILYVARVSIGGNISESMPCAACRNYLAKFTNIKKVVHT